MALFSTGLVPILHKLATHGLAGVQNFPLRHTAMTTTCYLIGTAFYVTHFPEKYILNTFDIWVSRFFYPSSDSQSIDEPDLGAWNIGSKPSALSHYGRNWAKRVLARFARYIAQTASQPDLTC